MAVNFFLANSKKQRTSIDTIVRDSGCRYKKSTGCSVDTKYWNHERQRASVTKDYREGVIVNDMLAKWKRSIETILYDVKLGKIIIKDQDQFWERVKCEIDDTPYNVRNTCVFYLSDYVENVYIPRFTMSKSESRINRFHVVLNKIRCYEKDRSKHLSFNDIDILFYRDFQSYIYGLNHKPNYLGTLIKIIKQFLREACEIDKLHDNRIYLDVKFKAISEDVDTVYLNVDELEKIYSSKIDEKFVYTFYPRIHKSKVQSIIDSYTIARNRFLIGAFTGLRMSDFSTINDVNIQNGTISKFAEKTGTKSVIPIHPIVEMIIQNGFDLNRTLALNTINEYIKDICQYVNIAQIIEYRDRSGGKTEIKREPKYKLVSSHTARRSFASNAYLAGVPSIAIMKITGHKTEQDFMRYIRVTAEENASILSEHAFFKHK